MILRRLGEGDETYYTYVEEATTTTTKIALSIRIALLDFTLNIFHNNMPRFFAVSFHITFKLYVSGIRYYLYKMLYVFGIMERIGRSADNETGNVDFIYTIPYCIVSNSKRVRLSVCMGLRSLVVFSYFSICSLLFFLSSLKFQRYHFITGFTEK